jgi:hypothetical protein
MPFHYCSYGALPVYEIANSVLSISSYPAFIIDL